MLSKVDKLPFFFGVVADTEQQNLLGFVRLVF
jgi:hypothetical protein